MAMTRVVVNCIFDWILDELGMRKLKTVEIVKLKWMLKTTDEGTKTVDERWSDRKKIGNTLIISTPALYGFPRGRDKTFKVARTSA